MILKRLYDGIINWWLKVKPGEYIEWDWKINGYRKGK